jgi:hypothetical protein
VFIVLGQYRRFAETLNGRYPGPVLEIAFYFAYYGKIARDTGLGFVAEAVAHDLARLVRHAWETEAPNRKLLERFLNSTRAHVLRWPGSRRRRPSSRATSSWWVRPSP